MKDLVAPLLTLLLNCFEVDQMFTQALPTILNIRPINLLIGTDIACRRNQSIEASSVKWAGKVFTLRAAPTQVFFNKLCISSVLAVLPPVGRYFP